MPTRIFIDANVYLRFYQQKSSGFKKLLEVLPTIRDDIFVTEQIVNEVMRNKLKIAVDSMKEVQKSFQIKGATFPEGFKGAETVKWNQTIEELRAKEKELVNLGAKVIESVASSKDTVTNNLSPLFSRSLIANADQEARAEKRKKYGNPPGKKGDPVGDQLSWIQFLDTVESGDKVFIVSYDGDFADESGGRVFLNPFLLKDLKDKGLDPAEVFCFKDLITALGEIKSRVNPELALPGIIDVQEIRKEELTPYKYYGETGTGGFSNSFGTSGFSMPLSGSDDGWNEKSAWAGDW
jgi:hypothetical protein